MNVNSYAPPESNVHRLNPESKQSCLRNTKKIYMPVEDWVDLGPEVQMSFLVYGLQKSYNTNANS